MTDENANAGNVDQAGQQQGGSAGGEGGAGGDGGAPLDGPDAYQFNAPSLDDLELPEGFNKDGFQLQIAEDDPDVPRLKELAHQHGLPQDAVDGLAKLWAGREIRQMHEAGQAAVEEMKQLGDNAQSRLQAAERAIRARLPEAQAEALLNDLTTAASIQAVEALLGRGSQPNGAQPGGRPSMADLSIDERLTLAQQQRAERRSRRR